jgi:KDO2-lipid IV(A) lauroyltransferase
MAAEVFANYARYWAESLRLPSLTREEIAAGVTTIGEEHVGAARAEGRGLVIASPHLGGWEWGAMYLIGKGVPVTAAVERLEPAAVFEWLVAFRERLGMHVVPVGPEASAGVLRALHNNEVACLLSDRLVGQASGVEVTFFGERVKLPAGPVALALRARAPILAAGIYYGRAANAHTIIFRPPLQLDRGRRFRDAVRDGAQALAAELEEVIRPAPTQWHILQPNWPGDPPLHTARSWAATLPWGGHRPALGAGAAGAPAAVP